MGGLRKMATIFNADNMISRILLVLVYTIIYDYLFESFVYAFFAYLNIDYVPLGTMGYAVWLAVSVFPFLFYHGLNLPSDYLNFFLYVFVYIPFIHAIHVMYDISLADKILYTVVLCVLFSLYFLSNSKFNLFRPIRFYRLFPLRGVEYVTVILSIILVLSNAKSMRFVNIFTESDLLYDIRAQLSDNNSGSFFNYLKSWLYGAFYPFLLVCYLKSKKWLLCLAVLVGYILLFMMDMQKMTFIMPFFLTALFFLIKLYRATIRQRFHSFFILILSILSLFFLLFQDNKVIFGIAAILILRTICVAGWLTEYYISFFNDHPYTIFSHVNIINAITHSYPYDDGLGIVVSHYSMNANATFFLMDGVASCGVIGVVIIGILYYIFFSLLNAVSYRYEVADLLIMLTPMISFFLNVSLFTTILTSGAFILFILLMGTDNPIAKKNCCVNKEDKGDNYE